MTESKQIEFQNKFKDLQFNWYSENCPYSQYINHVDESKFNLKDYSTWVNFYDVG